MIVVKTKELKKILGKINAAIEKSVFNPKSGWAQLTVEDGSLVIKASSFDYYINATIDIENAEEFNATVEAETFIPLISKIETEDVTFNTTDKALVVTTPTSEYNLPLQIDVETDRVRDVDVIEVDEDKCTVASLTGAEVASIASINAKGITDGTSYKKVIQQFIYVDNFGAITFTENLYVNTFTSLTSDFKMLLTKTQASMLGVFGEYEAVDIFVENEEDADKRYKVKFMANNIEITFIVQTTTLVNQVPYTKVRTIASQTNEAHAIIDKGLLNKALARLMVFDKKFGSNVMDYSKLEWGKDSLKLVSVKSKNYETIPYKSSLGTYEHESVIRFADLVEQLKAVLTNEIDIGYGETPAIALNAGSLKQLIPEVVKR